MAAKKILFSLITLSLSAFFALGLSEAGYRYFLFGFGPQFFTNPASETTRNLIRNGHPVELDKNLGWKPSPRYNGQDNIEKTTITIREDTTRSNGPAVPMRSDCRIIALGDSYTFGDEVSDEHSWPAQLEKQMGCQVINGGVPAYGIDQSYLRALELIKIYPPKTVLVSFIYDDINRVSMSIRQGLPKPFFTYEADKIIFHPVSDGIFEQAKALVTLKPSIWRQGKQASYLATYLTQSHDLLFWLGLNHSVNNNPKLVSCLLMDQLAKQMQQAQIHFYVVVQYSKWELKKYQDLEELIGCFRERHVPVIDTHQKMFAGTYAEYFNMAHMSPKGNKLIAEIIAESLAKPARITQTEGD